MPRVKTVALPTKIMGIARGSILVRTFKKQDRSRIINLIRRIRPYQKSKREVRGSQEKEGSLLLGLWDKGLLFVWPRWIFRMKARMCAFLLTCGDYW